MGLYKVKGSDVWHMSFVVDGRQVRKSTKQSDKYLAGLVLNDQLAKARVNGIDAILHRSPLLKEFAHEFKQWIEESQSLKFHTKRYYRGGLKLLGKQTALANMRMSEITNHVCDTLKFSGGPSNANQALRTLRRMFAKAKENNKFFGELPGIKLRQEWERSISMSEPDAEKIAGQMKEGNSKDAFLILRATGMRPNEVFSLRWEFLNWHNETFCNPQGKTKTARRVVPLPPGVMSILKQRHFLQEAPREGWVFPSDKSGCGHLVTIRQEFERARDKAGLPRQMVLYTARHGRLSDLAQVCTLPEVMRIGGHSDVKTAMRYQHTSTAQLEAKLEQARSSGRIQ